MNRPGSLAWLFAWELRLAWRAPQGEGVRRAVGLAAAAVFLLLFGLPLGLSLRERGIEPGPALLAGLDLALAGVCGLMLNLSLSAAVRAFYERGDLELLIASPLGPRKVLAARLAAIAASAFAFPAALASPLLLPAALFGHPAWLAGYAAALDLALLAAAAGAVLAAALFRILGPRATRTAGQALASALGVTVFLASQAARLRPDLAQALGRTAGAAAAHGLLSPWSPVSWPARAALGQPLPLAALTVLAVAGFSLAAFGLGSTFARGALLATGAPSAGRARRDGGRGRFGGSPFRALVVKEWRLIARDPALLSQMAARLAYLLPLGLLVLEEGPAGGAAAAAIAGPVSLAAGQLAGGFAWLTLSAEAAPDLIAASPAGGAAARRAKLFAALAPVGLAFAPPLVLLARAAPGLAALTLAGSAVSALCAGLVNLWMERPAPRASLGRRGASTPTLLAELAVGLGWAFAAALAALGSAWALAPAAVTALALAGIRRLAGADRAY